MSIDKYKGCLVGLAVGDALGTTLEFQPRDAAPKVTEMVGGGVFKLNVGEWTDDTSMALCLGQSLLDKDGFDAYNQMDKYWRWVEHGYMSSNGRMFDIGNATSEALCKYRKTGNPFAGSINSKSAGNGSIMRLAPIPMYFANDRINYINYAASSSNTTHAAKSCVSACVLLSEIIVRGLQGLSKDEILNGVYFTSPSIPKEPEILDIANGSYKIKTRDEIKSSGYVVHTLEAALWAFYNTNSFEDGCILAVNLANDSDSVGAVYGQIAGAYYGYSNIPQRWLDKLVKLDLIVNMAEQLYHKRK
jgi:ADP-ribosylglycohydrolase